MADIVTQNGLAEMLNYITGSEVLTPTLWLGLFVNNEEFSCDTLLADLVECTLPGYTRIRLFPQYWTAVVNGCCITYSYPMQVFGITDQSSPEQTVFGHFVIDMATGLVLWGNTWVQPWTPPLTVTQNPQLTPTIMMCLCGFEP